MLAVLAAGIGLVAMAMAKAGVDAQPHRMAGASGTQLVQHVDGAAINRNAQCHQTRQRGAVQQIGGENNLGMAVVQTGRVARCQRALHLAQRHRIHHHASALEQTQDVGVRVGLLRKTHHVKLAQRLYLALNSGCVIHPQRRAVLLSQ